MRHRLFKRLLPLLTIPLLVGLLASCGSDDDGDEATKDDDSGEVTTSRGFDGTTIKVASIGIKAQLPGVEWGAKARIQRFNEDNELDGIKIEWVEFADDKQDPATALSEIRRLVTAEEIFAIVGDVSAVNPGDYLKQQHVPYFGWAFDNTYCTQEPDDSIWGFGIYGCLVAADPPVMPDSYAKVYDYVKEKTGKDKPTIALFSNDNQSGRNSTAHAVFNSKGAGFDVVFAEGLVPLPPVTDYTPYVQTLLKSDDGHAPDAINCLLAIDCIPIWKLLQANNYQGTFLHYLYSDALLSAMTGTVAAINFVAFNEDVPALQRLKDDVAVVNPDQAIDTGVSSGYFSADMFIEALKLAAKDGNDNITPEGVREAASHMTWEIDGLVGPVKYPASTVKPTPSCNSLVENTDGSAWKTVVPYSCSDKTFKVTE